MEEKIQELSPYNLKNEQLAAIRAVINGSDVICQLPIGYGKSAIFHSLPNVLHGFGLPSKVIVVCPLTALMEDQLRVLKQIQIKASYLDIQGQIHTNNENGQNGNMTSIIYGHPEGFLKAEEGVKMLHELAGDIGGIVIDECHKIDDWGKDFRKIFEELGSLRSFFPKCPVICLSATVTREQIRNIEKFLGLKNVTFITKTPLLNNIVFKRYLKSKGDSLSFFESILMKEVSDLQKIGKEYPVTLFFMPLQHMSYAMRYTSHHLPSELDICQFGAIYSNQDKVVMDSILSDLKSTSPRFRLIFTTSVIGLGFDSPSICRVIHARPPRSLTDYFQEVGRVGRRGQNSEAILWFNKSDIAKNLPGIKDDIIKYCVTDSCLRDSLFENFGFSKDATSPTGCKCCSVCATSCECDDCLLCRHVNCMDL